MQEQSYLDRALRDGHAKLTGEGKAQKIVYLAVNHAERYSDPEEQVRAEFRAELIYRYGYEPARIGVEVTVPDHPSRSAIRLCPSTVALWAMADRSGYGGQVGLWRTGRATPCQVRKAFPVAFHSALRTPHSAI